MARGNQNINDQLYRTRSRNAAEERRAPSEDHRKRQIRAWIIVAAVVLAVLLGVHFFRGYSRGKDISMVRLPCYSNQNVTPFRDGVLYYDGASIHYDFNPRLARSSHGTGDVFASVFAGAILRGLDGLAAAALAADIVCASIEATADDHWYGVAFERTIPLLASRLANA